MEGPAPNSCGNSSRTLPSIDKVLSKGDLSLLRAAVALCFESSHFLCLCTPQGASDTRPPRLPPRPRCRLLREMRPFPAETRVRTEMQEWDVSFAVSWESQQCPDPAEAEDLGKNSQVSSGSTPMPALVSPRQGQRCRHRPALGG